MIQVIIQDCEGRLLNLFGILCVHNNQVCCIKVKTWPVPTNVLSQIIINYVYFNHVLA